MPRKSQLFNADDLHKQRVQIGKPYLEFLRVPAMSAGLYVLVPGATDRQSPHDEDEIYYVIRGCSRMRVGAQDYSVEAGSIIFVAAGVEHRFYEIKEEMAVLVIFAPAETA